MALSLPDGASDPWIVTVDPSAEHRNSRVSRLAGYAWNHVHMTPLKFLGTYSGVIRGGVSFVHTRWMSADVIDRWTTVGIAGSLVCVDRAPAELVPSDAFHSVPRQHSGTIQFHQMVLEAK